MSRKRKSRARFRGTAKQAAFVHHYFDPKGDAFGNATRACEKAGYRGEPRTLAVQGYRNLQNPDIQDAIGNALRRRGYSEDFAAKLLMDAMRANDVRIIRNKNGKHTVFKFPNHATRMQGHDRAERILATRRNERTCDRELPGNRELESESRARDRALIRAGSEKVKAMLRLIGEDKSISNADLRAVVSRLTQKKEVTSSGDSSEKS
jgi:phage terminase small subunit